MPFGSDPITRSVMATILDPRGERDDYYFGCITQECEKLSTKNYCTNSMEVMLERIQSVPQLLHRTGAVTIAYYGPSINFANIIQQRTSQRLTLIG